MKLMQPEPDEFSKKITKQEAPGVGCCPGHYPLRPFRNKRLKRYLSRLLRRKVKVIIKKDFS